MSALPWLPLLAQHPHLLTEHLQAYAELLADALAHAAADASRRLAWLLAALLALAVAGVLGGVSLLLWSGWAGAPAPLPGTLWPGWPAWAIALRWGVPLLPLAVAVACGLRLRCLPPSTAFATVREQLALDAQLLRQLAALP